MFDLLISTFVVLFVVIDPVGLAPVFIGLAHGGSESYRRNMALRGTAIAAVVLFVFVVSGNALLRILGITIPAFQIAGGILFFLLAVDMLFARQTGLRSTTMKEQKEAEHKNDISVFPLAIPLIAGPGAMTSVLLMVGREQGNNPNLVLLVVGVLAVVLLMVYLSLLFASRIMKLLGETGANVVSRLLGIVLAALAVQFVLDGVKAGFQH
jgi:multiple antibiotic resistance protein